MLGGGLGANRIYSGTGEHSEAIKISPRSVRVLLARLFDIAFKIFFFVTIFLPSGTIRGLNFKQPLYLILLPLALYRFFHNRLTPGKLILLITVPSLVTIWLLVGLYGEVPFAGSLRQYMDVVLTLLMCWLAKLYYGEDDTVRLSFLKLVLYSEVATCALKVALIGYALARGIPVAALMETISQLFGVDLMTMDIGALFGRVQFVSDSLIPLCIFLVLTYRHRLSITSFRATVIILLLCVSVVFGFSRYFWGFSVFALLLGLLLGRRDRFQFATIVALGVVIMASLPALTVVYQLRFSDAVAGHSDQDRFQQTHVLQSFFLSAPLLGHGLGSYSPDLLRVSGDSAIASRFSYEMQLLALAGQVGLLGITSFAALLAWYYRKLWWRSRLGLSHQLGLSGMILFWLSVGWYNPLLLTSVAGVVYATFAVLTEI